MTRRHLFRLLGVALLGLVVFGLSNHRGSANVDAEERRLEAFVEAAAAVDGVMASWQPKIARADEPTAETLRREANLEIRESIEQVDGISFTEYRDIHRALAVDPDLRDRVTDLMERMQRP